MSSSRTRSSELLRCEAQNRLQAECTAAMVNPATAFFAVCLLSSALATASGGKNEYAVEHASE